MDVPYPIRIGWAEGLLEGRLEKEIRPRASSMRKV